MGRWVDLWIDGLMDLWMDGRIVLDTITHNMENLEVVLLNEGVLSLLS